MIITAFSTRVHMISLAEGAGFSDVGVCNHAFHFHCISRWLKTRQVCPLGKHCA